MKRPQGALVHGGRTGCAADDARLLIDRLKELADDERYTLYGGPGGKKGPGSVTPKGGQPKPGNPWRGAEMTHLNPLHLLLGAQQLPPQVMRLVDDVLLQSRGQVEKRSGRSFRLINERLAAGS